MPGRKRLCRLGGVSRSTLYRLFEANGGVARFIQGERRKHAHAVLSDPADTRSVGRVAEGVALFNLSSFGMFRAAFGSSPRERRLAVAGDETVFCRPGGFGTAATIGRPAGASRGL